MKLYIYRVNDREYGASTSLSASEAKGTVVESWPLNTLEEAKFLAHHGSNFYGISEKVSKLADTFATVFTLDPYYSKADEQPKPIVRQKMSLLQRIAHAFKNTD